MRTESGGVPKPSCNRFSPEDESCEQTAAGNDTASAESMHIRRKMVIILI
jgi:hypothetical protein